MSSKLDGCVTLLITLLLSPTKQIANALKAGKVEDERAKVIKRLNWTYFLLSVGAAVGLFVVDTKWTPDSIRELKYLWYWFLISRCNEVFWAFLIDAREHFDGKAPSSKLTYGDRLALSLRSYVELMINFGIIYFLVPNTYWKDGHGFTSIIESVYFSGATITTTGYGDFTPSDPTIQMLSIYEVFCGVILLVVCFTIYASKGMAMQDTKNNSGGVPSDKDDAESED